MAVEEALVGQNSHPGVPLGTAGIELVPAEANGAFGGPEPPGEDPEQCGLPRPVGTEKGENLTGLEGEGHPVHGPLGAEGPDEPLGFEPGAASGGHDEGVTSRDARAWPQAAQNRLPSGLR